MADGSSRPPTGEWRQHAGFSMFVDVGRDAAGEDRWQTRIYHEESGEEIVLTAAEATGWLTWVLQRLDLGMPDRRTSPIAPIVGDEVARLSVHLTDLRVDRVTDERGRNDDERGRDDDERGRDDTVRSGERRVHLEAQLRITGLADVERSLGAALMRVAFDRPAP